jgi:hypothetical protein
VRFDYFAGSLRSNQRSRDFSDTKMVKRPYLLLLLNVNVEDQKFGGERELSILILKCSWGKH